MDLSWGDDLTKRACRVAEDGVSAWGEAGQRMVAEAFVVVDVARALAELVTFSARVSLGRLRSTPVIVIGYCAVEIFARPHHSQLGFLQVPPTSAQLDAVRHADQLAIHDVRCHGRAARREGAA